MSKIYCKLRKKYVEKTPEEMVRQNFIEELISIYNYDLTDDGRISCKNFSFGC